MMFVKALWWKLRISTTQTTVPKAGNRICDSVIQIQHPPEFTGHSCGTLPGCTAADVSIPPACRTQIPPKSQAWHQWIFLWFCEGGSIIKICSCIWSGSHSMFEFCSTVSKTVLELYVPGWVWTGFQTSQRSPAGWCPAVLCTWEDLGLQEVPVATQFQF